MTFLRTLNLFYLFFLELIFYFILDFPPMLIPWLPTVFLSYYECLVLASKLYQL